MNKLSAEIVSYFDDITDGDINVRKFFYNNDGMRLTEVGFKILSEEFESMTFEYDKSFTTGNLISLTRSMAAPYYINTRRPPFTITLFSDEQIVLCKMSGVAHWLDNLS